MGALLTKTATEKKTLEQRRKREIERYGVLLPPLFAIHHNSSSNNNNNCRHATCANSNSNINANSNNKNNSNHTCLAAWDRLPLNPSLVEYLSVTHLGVGLLQDFMTPGLWISASNNSSRNGRAIAATTTTTNSSSTSTTTVRTSLPLDLSVQGGGRVSILSVAPTSTNTTTSSKVELCVNTNGVVHLFATHPVLSSTSSSRGFIFAGATSMGSGYVGGQAGMSFDRTLPAASTMPIHKGKNEDNYYHNNNNNDNDIRNDTIQVQIGTWIPLQAAKTKTTTVTAPNKTYSNGPLLSANKNTRIATPRHVHGYIAVDMLGSTTALETKLDTTSLETEVSKYFSIRLLDKDDTILDDGGGGRNSNDATAASSPVWFTMTSNAQSSTMNVSQILAFDRINMNVLDVRAPRVRNILGWTVQIEKPTSTAALSSLEMESSPSSLLPSSKVSLGATWQCNRGLAFKLVGTTHLQNSNYNNYYNDNGNGNVFVDQSGGDGGTSSPYSHQWCCTLGIIMKRWKQPAMTCSVLGRYDFQSNRMRFLGIGLELETPSFASHGTPNTGLYNTSGTTPISNNNNTAPPEMKAVLR